VAHDVPGHAPVHRLAGDQQPGVPQLLKKDASESGDVTDLKDMELGVDRRFQGLELWMVMRTYGAAKLQEHYSIRAAEQRIVITPRVNDRTWRTWTPRR
jgi:tyrosine decarboxylase